MDYKQTNNLTVPRKITLLSFINVALPTSVFILATSGFSSEKIDALRKSEAIT